jgi:hypothetical protein
MKEAEIEERLRLLQREVTLAGEAVEELRRDHRAEIDALRLDIEVLRRCLTHLHPDFPKYYETLRTEVINQVDPETI